MSQERIEGLQEKIFPEKREKWFSPPERVEVSREEVTRFIQDRINSAEREAREKAGILLSGRGTREMGEIISEDPNIVVLEEDLAKGEVLVANLDDYLEALSRIMENLGVDAENPRRSQSGPLHHTAYSAKRVSGETVSLIKTTWRARHYEGKAQEGTVISLCWKVDFRVPSKAIKAVGLV